jgi:hypothetical protein
MTVHGAGVEASRKLAGCHPRSLRITSPAATRHQHVTPPAGSGRKHRIQGPAPAVDTCAEWTETHADVRPGKHFASEAQMSAVFLLVSIVAPAVFLQHWRRPRPARISYPTAKRSGGSRVH